MNNNEDNFNILSAYCNKKISFFTLNLKTSLGIMLKKNSKISIYVSNKCIFLLFYKFWYNPHVGTRKMPVVCRHRSTYLFILNAVPENRRYKLGAIFYPFLQLPNSRFPAQSPAKKWQTIKCFFQQPALTSYDKKITLIYY